MGTLDTALATRLKAHAGLSALVSTRVYAPPIPQGTSAAPVVYPLVTYQEIDTIPIHVMGGTAPLKHARYQVDSWGATQASAKAVAAQVEAALDNYAGTSDGVVIRNCFLDIGQWSPYDDSEGVFRYIQDYLLEYEP